MSKFLRQKWSGHIFPWSAPLAGRDDMEPYEPPAPAPAPSPSPPPLPAPEAPQKPVQAPVRQPKIPTQNLKSASDFPPLDEALKAFRAEAVPASRTKGEA